MRTVQLLGRAAVMLALGAMAAAFCAGCGGDSVENSSDETYTVTFDASGGYGAAPDEQTVNAGSSITLPNEGGLTKDGYAFDGWNTQNDGTGTDYGVGSSYTPTGDVKLYAKWRAVSLHLADTVTFDANGGIGTVPGIQIMDVGSSITLPNESGLIKGGHIFDGWNTNDSGTGTNYSAGSSYTPVGNITLYAKWEDVRPIFVDSRDGTSYKKVTIGSQTWMAENLNYDVENSRCYNNGYCKYGRLYDWHTVMNGELSSSAAPSGVQGLCPAGWHLPSDAEWTTLLDFVGGLATAGTKLKSSTGWANGGSGTDDYGFSALPGGSGYIDLVEYNGIDYYGCWWSATELDDYFAMDGGYIIIRRLNMDMDAIDKRNRYSVRCVEDCGGMCE